METQIKDPTPASLVGKHFLAAVIYVGAAFVLVPLFGPFSLFLLLGWIPHAIILLVRSISSYLQKKPKLGGIYLFIFFAMLIIGLGSCAFILTSLQGL
jgi:hypothetical protein